MLTAIQTLNVMKASGRRISALAAHIPIYPQVLVNIVVNNVRKAQAMQDPEMWSRIREVEGQLGDGGRVLVRASGTEPLIRVMLEGEDADEIGRYAVSIAKIIEKNYDGRIKN